MTAMTSATFFPPQLTTIPEENYQVQSFDQHCSKVPDAKCQELALKVCKTWSEIVLFRSSSHEVFKIEGVAELILHYTGEYHKCCKISLTKSLVFCPPPSGKPDPNYPMEPKFLSRPRIIQTIDRTHDNSAYYAALMISERIGKRQGPYASQKDKRTIERWLSSRRKNHASTHAHFSEKFLFVENLKSLIGPNLTKEIVKKIISSQSYILLLQFCALDTYEKLDDYVDDLYLQALKSIEHLKKEEQVIIFLSINAHFSEHYSFVQKLNQVLLGPITQEKIHQLLPYSLLSCFCDQQIHDTLDDYLTSISLFAHTFVDQQFLSKTPISPMQFYRKELEPLTKRKWQDLSLREQYGATHVYADRVVFEAKDLQKSFWHPSQKIDALVRELWLHGPHIVFACLEPTNVNSLQAIVIIGAYNSSNTVYYRNPMEDSDPLQHTIVYPLFYPHLQERITDLNRIMKRSNGQPDFTKRSLTGPNNYAVHGNPRTAHF